MQSRSVKRRQESKTMFGCVERRGTHDPREAHEVDVTLGVARLIAMARAFRMKAEQHERLSDEVRTAQANLRRAILLAFADGLTADDIRFRCIEPALKRSTTSEEAAAAVEQTFRSIEKAGSVTSRQPQATRR
jgi:hypothetical protein